MNLATEIAVIGAGPAGLAAAACAAECGKRVLLVDDNPLPGGQIWRAQRSEPHAEASGWQRRARAAGVEWLPARQAIAAEFGRLWLEGAEGDDCIRWEQLIIATGARELLLPFAGWTLPNCYGAGGLQALVKAGLEVRQRRIVVAGSGPLLPAVAAYLREHGAQVLLVAEQASAGQLAMAAAELLRFPARRRQAWRLRAQLRGIPYLTGCWVEKAEGQGLLQCVWLRRGDRQWKVECDYLACGYGLVANTELGELLGCERSSGQELRVDRWQRSSVEGIWCAGEAAGIAGIEAALLAGQIAGYAAAGRRDLAEPRLAGRDRERRGAQRLLRRFALRPELKQLAPDDTWLCRCEDVRIGEAKQFASWRSAKLQTRCGMGACQGRICGAAGRFLFGWQPESARPPLRPTRVATLATMLNYGDSPKCP